MSQITLSSLQKPTQALDAKTIRRDSSVRDPTLIPSQDKNAHSKAKLNKVLRSYVEILSMAIKMVASSSVNSFTYFPPLENLAR